MQVTNCRLCNSTNLTKWLDLGHHPHSDQFRKSKDVPETQYPLRMLVCNDCGLSQLSYIVEKEVMYTDDYLYEASITATADKHWKELADDVVERTGITKGFAVDIGGNDGTLSLKFKELGFDVLNIDPCKEVTDISRERGVNTITGFFEHIKVYRSSTEEVQIIPICQKADLITGTNVFAHIHDLNTFMADVKTILAPNGVFVFESPYFGEFYKNTEFDTIYHQHLSYLSVKPLVKFLDKFDMEVFDIVFSPLHGGAFRCYIARKGQHEVKPIVEETIKNENWTLEDLKLFAKRTEQIRTDLMSLLWKLKGEGKSIVAVSSPAKGQTLMNYCGIKDNLIDFVTEKSKLKIGRFTPGSHIEIVGDDKLIEKQPDYALLLAWNFADEIIANNKDFKGSWIIPIPNVIIRKYV